MGAIWVGLMLSARAKRSLRDLLGAKGQKHGSEGSRPTRRINAQARCLLDMAFPFDGGGTNGSSITQRT